jgi:hypothetical protein
MDVDFATFSALGLEAEKSRNPAGFNETKNAWAVAVGVNRQTPDGVPVLFTANISRHPESFTPLSSLTNLPFLARDGIPYGNTGGVVIQTGGSAFTVKSDTLITQTFNPIGATNTVLYP